MKLLRWQSVGLTATILAGMAAASDDAAKPASTPDPRSQAQTAGSQQTPNSIPDSSEQQEKSAPLLDRRDRIFYPSDTERIKPLGKKLFLNILMDEEDIFSSPFRMNRHNAKWWVLGAATTAGLIAADRHIANSLENSNVQVHWGGRISNIGAEYTLIPLLASYYGFGAWVDHAKAREIGVLGTESMIDGMILVGVLKEVARRNRPDEKDPGKFWGGGTSFPSGHAIQMWSVASLVAHEYPHQPAVRIAAYSLAGIVSAARIAARKHFASDVVVGGTMGWFIGRYVYQTHMSHLAHKHSALIPMFVPQVQPSQGTYALSLQFGGVPASVDPMPQPVSVLPLHFSRKASRF